MPAEAFGLGQGLCFLESCYMQVTAAKLLRASPVPGASRFGGQGQVSLLPLLVELGNGARSWTQLGDTVDPLALSRV